MRLEQAQKMAKGVKAVLEPYCEPGRCVIAGSVRRKKWECGDVEIVCVPKLVQNPDSLIPEEIRHPGFCATVMQWPVIKGDAVIGKYTQRRLAEGFNLDLFIATPDNFGLQLAIRTGSAEFSHYRLAGRWSRLGYKSEGGILYRDGIAYPIREERDLFNLLGLEYVEPEEREI